MRSTKVSLEQKKFQKIFVTVKFRDLDYRCTSSVLWHTLYQNTRENSHLALSNRLSLHTHHENWFGSGWVCNIIISNFIVHLWQLVSSFIELLLPNSPFSWVSWLIFEGKIANFWRNTRTYAGNVVHDHNQKLRSDSLHTYVFYKNFWGHVSDHRSVSAD